MGCYFFNIYGREDLFDEEGIELPDDDAAREHMVAMAVLWMEKEENQEINWSVEVRDRDEDLVASMSFGKRLS